ncbi:MAG: hypothetical protein AB2660_03800 [Candidatus Thiodiazotropha sp.]|nr:hypothetical protein [Candidatus Thiodiazotropha sp. (ex Lucina pensylvanica)]MBT3061766.1 hypothetical protein [Candidatus Thiodiazotropha sp. (ex Lucina pensylvanica)]
MNYSESGRQPVDRERQPRRPTPPAKEKGPNMIKHLLLSSLLSLISVSCGNDSDVDINEFDITGSAADLEDGSAPVDPAINSGRFDLTWKVDDDNAFGYTARFFLSLNSNLDESNDIAFFSAICDEFASCDRDRRNDEACFFSNDLVMFCGDEDDAVKRDVDEIVDSLPMDAYIIIEACTTFDCDTASHPVRLL